MVEKRAPEIVKKYALFIKKNIPGVKKVILFGSYARGTHGQDSDIDLAVILETLPDSFEMQVELMKLRRKFDTRIEPHPIGEIDFNPSNPLANEVLKSGIEV